jgi:hypothetical protein
VAADPDYTYRIRVRAKKGHFTARDRIRILLTASREVYVPTEGDALQEAVEFLDASREGELYPPADHPLALTVGDSAPDSSVGPTADRRAKPDVLLEDSRASFSDGQVSVGSSNAAAYVAGVVAVLKAAEPGLRTRHLLLLARQGTPLPRAATRAAVTTRATVDRTPGSLQVFPPSPDPRAAPGFTDVPVVTSRTPSYASPSALPSSTPRPTQPATPPPSQLRTWKTPSRARLAEMLREGR